MRSDAKLSSVPEIPADLHDRALERIRQCEGFIIKLARSWAATTEVDVDDLIQEGRLGVLEGVRDYDETRGFAFLTYASFKIRARMRRFALNTRDTIRIPTNNTTAKRRYCISLDAPVSQDNETKLHDAIAAPEPETMFVSAGAAELLDQAMATLPAMARTVLHLRFWEHKTQREIAQMYDVTHQAIQQHEYRGIRLLREHELLQEVAA